MESVVYISKQVFVVFLLYIWTTVRLNAAKATNQDNGTFDDASLGCVFYQQSEYPRDCQEVQQRLTSFFVSGVYFIKPDGYREPFEVYCDNVNSGGWTVIQRRIDDTVDFDREWDEYKEGFGFLSHNYWIGNDKLSYLTNQGVYELLVEIELTNGSTVYVTYRGFRISDEWGGYSLLSLGKFTSGGSGSITFCPHNMIYGNCTCQYTCEEPNSCKRNSDAASNGCCCPEGFLINEDKCVPRSECPCFWSEVDRIIAKNQTAVNGNFTERRTCNGGHLVHDCQYGCGLNAQCQTKDGERKCRCNDGFRRDGQTCEALYTDCYDAYIAGHTQDGLYPIKPVGWNGTAFFVPCVMNTTYGGGWTVFQRRTGVNRQVNFFRNWTSYKGGFGPLGEDFWLGNEKIHYLTNQKRYKLRVDAVGSKNSAIYGEWSTFSVGPGEDKYRLAVAGHSGNSVDMACNNGKAFSTYDQDNDDRAKYSCATNHRGGWWYYGDPNCSPGYSSTCTRTGNANAYCTKANPNGDYNGGNGENIFFITDRHRGRHSDYCNLKSVEMKLLPTN